MTETNDKNDNVAKPGLWSELAKSAERKHFIDVSGKRTQVLVGGTGDPLIYLHSSGGETIWLPFHDALSRHFTVIAPANPGVAESEGLDQIDGMEDVIFHYLDFFEAMGLEKANIVGLSLGGWIALEFAMRYPERVNKLIIVDAAGLYVEGAPVADLFAYLSKPARIREIVFNDPDSFIAQMASPNVPTPEQAVLAYRSFTAAARIGWDTYFTNPKMPERLRRIKAPTLIIWGENDKLIPVAHGKAYHEKIKNSQLVIIPDCGHMPILEAPEKFVNAVADFIRS